jgi:type I restriction enzyme S subunit
MSFPRYPTYKDSGVEWLGEVPGHWVVRRLKQACHVFPSNVDKKTHDGETPVQLCNYTDVYYNDTVVAGMEFMAATASTDQIAKFTLRAGDTIITKDSETADDIAIGAYVPADLPGVVCGYHLSMIRPLANTKGAFVKRLFDSIYTKSCVAVRANGLTRVGLGQYDLDNLDLPFPPLPEQTQIAAFLDRETAKIDALVAEQRRLMDLLKEKRQAVISHAVTRGLNPDAPMKASGVEWLGAVPVHWEATKLKYLTTFIVDCPHETPIYSDDGAYSVIRTADIDEGRVDESKMYRVSESEYRNRIRRAPLLCDDIVYGREGERWGHAALVSESDRFCLGQRMMQFRAADGVCPEFLMWALNAETTYRQGEIDTVGATTPHVNVWTIRNYNVAHPPLAEQREIGSFLRLQTKQFDILTTEAQHAIDLLQERRTALISAAVTGQIDVRDAVAV